MICKKIELDTYPVIIHVFIDATDDEIRQYIEIHNCTNYQDIFTFTDQDEAAFCYEKSSSEVYLRFRNTDDPAIIAHEALHAAAYIMRYIGVRFSRNSEEAYAYLLQTLIDRIYEEPYYDTARFDSYEQSIPGIPKCPKCNNTIDILTGCLSCK